MTSIDPVAALGQLDARHGRTGERERQDHEPGPIPLADTPGTPCPSGYEGCDHDLTAHSADLGCWLCDCTYGREGAQ